MKVIGVISTAALFLLLGNIAPSSAQEDHHEEGAKPQKQEQQAKPAQHEEQAKAPKQEQQQAKPMAQEHPQAQKQTARTPARQVPQQQAKVQPSQQHQQQAGAMKPAEQRQAQGQQAQQRQQRPERSVAQQREQRSQPGLRLSVRTNGRIPDDRFRSNFGRGHTFRMSPMMVGGYSRFQYGGYWFGFVQPWPVDWYYTDDVYVDYIDGGYYLCDPYYPDARVSISVVL
jgi:hypothetical protein